MTSRLVQMQARIQQKQMEEKEEKMLRLYEDQQQRAFKKVGRGSAGSNNNIGVLGGGGKVRQMFDERRQKAGIDRSYPLEPLKGSRNGTRVSSVETTRTTRTISNGNNNAVQVKVKTTERNVTNLKNGTSTKRIVQKEQTRTKSGDEVISRMLNNNKICDGLDDVDRPDFGFIEMEDPVVGKLDNVGSKAIESNKPKTNGKVSTAKPETNSNARKPAGKTVAKSHPSPAQSMAQSGLSKKPSAVESSRMPSVGKPSAKQTARSAVVRDDLDECKFCGRHFATDRLTVHESICAKTGKKKRKTYDATKHRIQGTELEPFVGPTKQKSAKAKQTPKKDWRRTHEEFIAAIRSAKIAQAHVAKGGKLSDLPPPPPSSNPDYVQCPHCGRRFNETAAERHIPKCASYQFNKKSSATKKK